MLNVLHVTSEVSPYSQTGGLGDVLATLPRALRLQGQSVSVLSPFYPGVADKTGPLSKRVDPLKIQLGQSRHTADVHEYRGQDGVRHFFVDIPALFDRPGIYGENGADYPDNAVRFAVFARAAVALIQQYDIGFDVVHCHDWQSALAPLYRASIKDTGVLSKIGFVLTIHNLAFQGLTAIEEATSLGIPERFLKPGDAGIEHEGQLSFLKAGIQLADHLTTVSPRYAEEIRTPELGAGLDTLLEKRRDSLTGILNGVDYSTWSPEIDPLLPYRFTVENQNGKRRCKAELETRFDLAVRPRIPLIGVVSRLAEQKGIDLLIEAVEPLLAEHAAHLVVLGDGDGGLESEVRALRARHPGAVGVHIGFDEPLSHLVYGGADIFAMPSRFEPCGLSQLYAMRYGAIPVVRDTGGLHDTVSDYDAETGDGTGFRFSEPTAEALRGALDRALDTYHQVRRWRKLVSHAMQTDFSWKRAAQKYVAVYESVLERVRERK